MILSFQKRKSQTDKSAKHAIIVFTVNINHKTSGKVSTGLKINPKIWDTTNYCAKGGSQEATIFNREIDSIKKKIHDIKFIFENITKKIDYTAQDIVTEWKQSTSANKIDAPIKVVPKTFLEVYEEWLVIENSKQQWHKNTRSRHNSMFNKMKKFVNEQKFTSIMPEQIKAKFLDSFAQENQNIGKNYVAMCIGDVKNVVRYAIKEEYIKDTSILVYQSEKQNINHKIHLTTQELALFENFTTDNVKLQKVKDIFVFMCYTGQNYVDYQNFAQNPNNYLNDQNGTTFIRQNRQKIQKRHQTKVEAVLPFLPVPKAIFDSYNGILPTFKTCKIINNHLKIITEILGIVEKKVTTKVARKTFANYFWNKGVKPLAIMKMLGHTSLATTQNSYTDTSADFIEDEMKSFF